MKTPLARHCQGMSQMPLNHCFSMTLSALVSTGKRWNVLHLLVQRLIVHWPVVYADFVLSRLEMVKVGYCVLHPVLIVTLCEVLPGMSASALLHRSKN